MLRQIRSYGVQDETVLAAMANVPRDRFIPAAYLTPETSYGDHPWDIGYQQTISQPYIVAYMTACLGLSQAAHVLEIGTGSGYQTAVLAQIAAEVHSLERIPELSQRAAAVLRQLQIGNVYLKIADGFAGWPEHAPYDGILVTCAPSRTPPALIDQLAIGGRMILPVGRFAQRLRIIRRTADSVIEKDDLPVRFVPMLPGTGKEPE